MSTAIFFCRRWVRVGNGRERRVTPRGSCARSRAGAHRGRVLGRDGGAPTVRRGPRRRSTRRRQLDARTPRRSVADLVQEPVRQARAARPRALVDRCRAPAEGRGVAGEPVASARHASTWRAGASTGALRAVGRLCVRSDVSAAVGERTPWRSTRRGRGRAAGAGESGSACVCRAARAYLLASNPPAPARVARGVGDAIGAGAGRPESSRTGRGATARGAGSRGASRSRTHRPA